MTKIVEVTGSIQEWVHRNSNNIRIEILESCELGLEENVNSVDVIMLKTKKGITKFCLGNVEKIVAALQLSINHFVKNEEYELAARTRDCIAAWEKRKVN